MKSILIKELTKPCVAGGGEERIAFIMIYSLFFSPRLCYFFLPLFFVLYLFLQWFELGYCVSCIKDLIANPRKSSVSVYAVPPGSLKSRICTSNAPWEECFLQMISPMPTAGFTLYGISIWMIPAFCFSLPTPCLLLLCSAGPYTVIG